MIKEQTLAHNEAIHKILIVHKFNEIAILFYFQVLLVWFWLRKNLENNKEYSTWVLFLSLGTLAVLYQGYLGGKMVFKFGAGVEPMKKQLQGEEHEHGGEKKRMSDTSKTKEEHGDEHKHDDGSMKDMKGMDDTQDMKDIRKT